MAVQTIVNDPEMISDVGELDDILKRINDYEKERGCNGGVLLIQNMQIGGIHMIESEEEASEYMNKPKRYEFGIKFYSREDLEKLREKLAYGEA